MIRACEAESANLLPSQSSRFDRRTSRCDNFGYFDVLNRSLIMMNSNSSQLIRNYRTVEDKMFGSQSRSSAQPDSPAVGGAKDAKISEPLGRKPAEASGSGNLPQPSTNGAISQPVFNTAQPAPSTDEADLRTLIIGPGVSVSGEITSCNRLIVQGKIEAKLADCPNVIIKDGGVFKGESSTDEADVQGSFEGNLVVRKRLLVRATGRVSGMITYGEIEIERGGQISGEIKHQRESAVSDTGPAPARKPLTGSLQAAE